MACLPTFRSHLGRIPLPKPEGRRNCECRCQPYLLQVWYSLPNIYRQRFQLWERSIQEAVRNRRNSQGENYSISTLRTLTNRALESNPFRCSTMFCQQIAYFLDVFLPQLAGSLRSAVNRSTGFAPNMSMLGREVTMPVELVFQRERSLRECPYSPTTIGFFSEAYRQLGAAPVKTFTMYPVNSPGVLLFCRCVIPLLNRCTMEQCERFHETNFQEVVAVPLLDAEPTVHVVLESPAEISDEEANRWLLLDEASGDDDVEDQPIGDKSLQEVIDSHF